MAKMNVTAIKHKDVRGKELMYLRLENEGQEVLINVGVKTYTDVLNLENPNQMKMDLKEPITKIQIAEPLTTDQMIAGERMAGQQGVKPVTR